MLINNWTVRTYIFVLFLSIPCFTFSQNNKNISPKDTLSNTLYNDLKVKALGDSIQSAIGNYDTKKYLSYFSEKEFNKLVKNQTEKEATNKAFYKGMLSGMSEAFKNIPNKIISELKDNGYYDFVNYRYDDIEQTYYILFRLYTNAGLNYHDYRVKKNKKTKAYEFVDIYVYLTGEAFSDTLSRLMNFALIGYEADNKNTVAKQDFINLERAIKANQLGDSKRAYNMMNKIKSDISKDKFFLILKSLMAVNINEEIYLKSLEELLEYHGNDPTVYLNKIDYYLLKNMNYEAIECVEKLKKITEDDFLNYSKANIAYLDKNYQVALDNYKYIVDNYDGFFEAQSSYLAVLCILEHNDEAISYLNSLIKEYDKDELITYLEEVDENGENVFKNFIKTNSYKNWKTSK
ncbi:hypothetical protein DFQ05_0466 [Winogradskyella wandonensis]|uniref:Tetratricopeptide repeat protein n=1 Tax=Winogradskyella wandonensis TaxID=1442586 RepID=A0A4R1KUU3_9FLAO|nr:hypothetical protein [Winogradskyella wandonensis]TCK68956.1 hypothetical protein DFQ05_0466 [Winogradskyella wandonensis]